MRLGRFDAEAFYAALDQERVERSLNWRQVAKEAEISPSTLTRMAQGRRPDVDTMAALAAWSGLDAGQFIRRADSAPADSSSLAQITAYLRADPQLSPKAADAIRAVLEATYEQLAESG